MTIKTKIFIILLIAVVVTVFTGVILYNSKNEMNSYFEKEDITLLISKGVFELNLLTNDFINHPLIRTRNQWINKHNSLLKVLNTSKSMFHNELFYFKEIEQKLNALKIFFFKLREEVTSGQLKNQSYDSKLLLYESKLSTLSHDMIRNAQTLEVLIHSQLKISQNKSSRFVFLLFISFSLLLMIFSWLILSSVLKPVILLTKGIESIGKGVFDYKIKVSKQDEIGLLSTTFNEMSKSLNDITVHRSELEKEIVERKQAEREIIEREELFRAVFDQTGGYSMILRPSDSGIPTIIDVNKAACRDHGYVREEMIGRPVADLDDEEGKRLCIERTKNIMTGQPFTVETNHVRKDGSIFPVAVYANIVRFEDKPPLIVTTEFDISDKKKAEAEKLFMEKQLQQSKKMESIGTLAGGIAHDFNNILYPIIGFAQLSQSELPKDHPVQENLTDIFDGAKRARDLVKQILKFSRQEKQVLKPTILKPVIQEAMKLLRSTIPANIDIQSHLYDQEDYVLCDATEIHEIVMNLCTNAYHSMEQAGGIIIVRLEKQNPPSDLNLPSGEYICLSVSDNGVGIPQEIIDKIFEPYFTSKEIGKGSGLGLSVVHGIVTNYKGDISVESSPGKGSVFNVLLPVTTQSKKVDDTQIVEIPLKGTENILFVDDEASIVKLAKRILERLGYSITGKTSCVEALELFKAAPEEFDLVITDMAMPIMTGTEFSKRILRTRPDIPIIICTGFSESVDSEIAKSIGIKEYIKKPILTEELTAKIREVLNQSSKG